MRTDRPVHNVLVPIFGGDVSEAALDRARAALDDPETRLVLLHVVPTPARAAHRVAEPDPDDGPPPRWRRLAADATPGRVLVDAVLDEPAHAILAHADRFCCDRIVVDPADAASRAASHRVDRAIAHLLRASPERVVLASAPPASPTPSPREPGRPHADRFPQRHRTAGARHAPELAGG